jgi:transposase
VHDLLAAGRSLTAISHELELDHSTVRRFARAATVAELLVKATNRTSVLDRFADHLTTRSAAGVTDATALHAELQALGFTGSVQTIRRYLHPLRPAAGHQPSAARPRPAVPKPRRLTGWIMTDPDHLTDTDRTQLTTALASCPELAATARHVREFADLMRTRRGERLPDWMHRVQDDNLPALHSRQHSRRPSA